MKIQSYYTANDCVGVQSEALFGRAKRSEELQLCRVCVGVQSEALFGRAKRSEELQLCRVLESKALALGRFSNSWHFCHIS
jgi:hypothetical protein